MSHILIIMIIGGGALAWLGGEGGGTPKILKNYFILYISIETLNI